MDLSFISDLCPVTFSLIASWLVCVCVLVCVVPGRREAKEQGVQGGGCGGGVVGGGGSCAPEREAISQLVCSLGSQAENATDLWSKLKWCQ